MVDCVGGGVMDRDDMSAIVVRLHDDLRALALAADEGRDLLPHLQDVNASWELVDRLTAAGGPPHGIEGYPWTLSMSDVVRAWEASGSYRPSVAMCDAVAQWARRFAADLWGYVARMEG